MKLPPDAALIAVYHYIRPPGRGEPGIRPLFVPEFEAQLDWLERHFQIVSLEELAVRLSSSKPQPRPTCALTFDDGLRDHVEVVAPLLRRRRLPGAFFVFTRPWEEGEVAGAHKLHLLLSRVPADQIWEMLPEALRARTDREAALRAYHYEDEEARALVKFALHFVASEQESSDFLDREFEKHVGEEENWVPRFYLTPSEARGLADEGFQVENHGYSHSAFQHLGLEAWQLELERSHACLSRATGRPPRFFAPCFGQIGELRQGIRAGLERLGYLGLLTSPEGINRPGEEAFCLKRVDCIHLPPRLPEAEALSLLSARPKDSR